MRLDDPSVRVIAERWVIRATISLASAAHFGGAHDDDDADMMLLRDRVTGRPLLPGSSLAGALRSHLADRLSGYGSPESKVIEFLFGARGDDSDDAGPQSSVIVFDALGTIPAGMSSEIRDGIAIVPATGIAEEHFKYDIEVLPAGTTFAIRVDLLVRHDGESDRLDPAFRTKPATFGAGLLALLAASLDGLNGDISLGAKRSRGFGRLSLTDWKVDRFDLTTRAGWLEWLASDHEDPCSSQHSNTRPADPAIVIDERRRIVVTANLEIDGGIQIASPSPDPSGADVAHLQSGGNSVVAGTSLAGALRNRALRIAHVVRPREAEQWVDGLFGPRNNRNHRASRLRVSEARIDGGRRLRPTRIRIDRFTQGVVDGALFDEEPQFGGSVEVRFELRQPQTGEKGFLLLLLKDLLTGDLPIGGTTSVGRGVLKGRAVVEMPGDDAVSIDPSIAAAPAIAEKLNRLVREFHEAPPMEKGTQP